jgi:ABC-type oligopeptide transport system substrate-binding subunit
VKFFHGVLRLLALAIMALAMPALAMAEVTITAPGQSTSGTYMDYMKTVYQRAGAPELIMLPLTAFDNNYQLQPMGAKSWEQSKDGLTWTFHLQDNLLWSDGTPLTAEDYVFALQRAAKEGYDFNWYWQLAGGIKGWSDVTDKHADPSTLAIKAVDDKTLEVTTDTPKSYFPGVASLWYPVPKHVVDKIGDAYALNVNTLVASGPFMVQTWDKSDNTMTLVKNPNTTPPGRRRSTSSSSTPSSGRPMSASRPSCRVRRIGPRSTPDRCRSSSSASRTPSAPMRCSRSTISPSTSTRRRSTTSTCARPSSSPSIAPS